ncbi:PREDICTED: lamin tail domain-containing protein 1 [Tinamus guttatus]|uniref:lamin tail domain-containing protein 1 n=1 Tax=Tinamus guttatus TaxID=94827 RepID=UPI00052EBADA|nr:PREDICTED: lamin tail domain-containing protein 1 [Tinamus guttatus]
MDQDGSEKALELPKFVKGERQQGQRLAQCFPLPTEGRRGRASPASASKLGSARGSPEAAGLRGQVTHGTAARPRYPGATGNLIIAEVHPGGLFLKILNRALQKEESIGDHLLMQNVQGQPVAVFRFPPKIRMAAGSVVTVWAANAEALPKPPSDFLWKDLERFKTGFNCATILCEPNGQAVAWYIPRHCSRRQGWGLREEREKLENIMKPFSSPTEQQEGWEREQEPAMMDTEWKRPDPGQTRTKRRSFIKREEQPSAPLFPARSAWCQSPGAPTHPHFSLVRPLAMGNDGSSLCRQSRCQSARPDPVPGPGEKVSVYFGYFKPRKLSAHWKEVGENDKVYKCLKRLIHKD